MGRRVRTTCSPIDSAMEKYHCDIGNRLSGVFMPTYLTSDNGKPLAEDFCMLTLDTRHKNSIKNKVTEIPDNTDSSSEISSSCVSTHSSARSEDDSLPKEKSRLVDKLTRALFQRKHTCARCKRRSRSCMPNKTFSSTGKHYMCERCRENSHAVKSLFVDQSVSNDSDCGTSKSSSSTVSQSKQRFPPEPRTHLNDSGYDTVTSCSTVASAYSAFNSPSNGTNSQEPAHSDGQKIISNRNIDTPKLNHIHEKSDTDLHTQYVCANPLTTSDIPVNRTTSELHQFLGVGQHGSPVLKQVKNRNLNNYDGYLPQMGQQGRDQIEFRNPLSDATNFEGYVENGDSFQRGDNSNSSDSLKQADPSEKICYLCKSTNKPCFRLKWEGSWLCEDCLDHVF